MRKPAAILFSSLTFILPQAQIFADSYGDPDTDFQQEQTQSAVSEYTPQPEAVAPPVRKAPIQAFTGRITKSKVRMRTQASTDAPVVKEVAKGDLFIVVGESDDFYAVQPPTGTKAYIFRTYVLDNVVEGNKINVRLQPDVDAPAIGQLNGGDRVYGSISTANNKWLEISPPESTKFYIAKDFVENIGDSSLLVKIQRRQDEVNQLIDSANATGQKEMQKSFPEINIEPAVANYNKVITSYTDFPDQVARAKELLGKLQNDYLQKKIPYLEAQANNNSKINDQVKTQQQKLQQLEQQLQNERAGRGNTPVGSASPKAGTGGISDKMALWIPVEQNIYNEWAQQNNNGTMEEFYQQQGQQATVLKGIVEPYTRVVKNKPGDYVIINPTTHLPIAFVYSTIVNLQDSQGREITLYGSPRANNNFAYPAYFILGVE